ncbi:MAG: hypothetical protein WC848_00435 [Parcubacteria group bacterium]|jgi:hypothetical protein
MKEALVFLSAIIVVVSIATSALSNEVERHLRTAKEWRESFYVVAIWLESQQIGNVADFIETNITTGKLRPDCNMIEPLEDKKFAKLIFMVPVFEDERQLSINWEDTIFSPPAQFLPDVRSIMVKGDTQFSYYGKAIVLSREYARAYYILNRKYKKGDYWVMERDAQTFQNNFLSFLGEKKYRRYVYGEARKIIKEMTNNKKLAKSFFLFEPTEYDHDLDVIFGKPASCEEGAHTQKAVWRHIMFIVLENTAKKGKAGSEKIEFVKSLDIYQEGAYRRESLDFPDYGIIRKK